MKHKAPYSRKKILEMRPKNMEKLKCKFLMPEKLKRKLLMPSRMRTETNGWMDGWTEVTLYALSNIL